MTSSQSALPAGGAFEVEVWQEPDPDADEEPAWSFSFEPPGLEARLYVHEGSGPDRETRWCATSLGALTLDTLILRPDADTASALWRVSWAWADHAAGSYRRIVVEEAS